VDSVCVRNDKEAGGEILLAGGKDRTLTAFKIENGGLTKLWQVATDSPPRAIDLYNG